MVFSYISHLGIFKNCFKRKDKQTTTTPKTIVLLETHLNALEEIGLIFTIPRIKKMNQISVY